MKRKNILLVEPGYKNKYPPLGLMKISTYHKQKGDNVVFCKGKIEELKKKNWDRIYITTLFTFYWSITLDTIKYYYNSVKKPSDIFTGGVLATVMYSEFKAATGVTVTPGLLDKPGVLGNDDVIVDLLPPDYSIIDPEQNKYLQYKYPTSDSYIAYATRGCIRHCAFCAVPTLEPIFKDYISLKGQVEYINKNFGEKRNLLLLDNNVLASTRFKDIIQDIIDLGFYKDAKYTYMKNGRRVSVNRYVDFNQGIDSRLLTESNMELLSEIAIRPLRIAFDHADETSIRIYTEKVRLAAKYGINNLSNYILFNFSDTPEDLYKRLRINVELNEEFKGKGYKTRVWSFPMRYSPIKGPHCKDRKYIGKHWNKKYIRGLQCILNSTHGVVGPKLEFFERAFGKSFEEFKRILLMPEDYIINRKANESNGLAMDWLESYKRLEKKESAFLNIIKDNDIKNLKSSYDKDLDDLLKHYKDFESECNQEKQINEYTVCNA